MWNLDPAKSGSMKDHINKLQALQQEVSPAGKKIYSKDIAITFLSHLLDRYEGFYSFLITYGMLPPWHGRNLFQWPWIRKGRLRTPQCEGVPKHVRLEEPDESRGGLLIAVLPSTWLRAKTGFTPFVRWRARSSSKTIQPFRFTVRDKST